MVRQIRRQAPIATPPLNPGADRCVAAGTLGTSRRTRIAASPGPGSSPRNAYRQRLAAVAVVLALSVRAPRQRPSPKRERGPAFSRTGPRQRWRLVNGVDDPVGTATQNDHGRDGPKQKDRHGSLLSGCPCHMLKLKCPMLGSRPPSAPRNLVLAKIGHWPDQTGPRAPVN